METIVLGLLVACGAGLSALIGATTAWIQGIERKLVTGEGTMADVAEVKRLRKARAWAGVGVVISLIVLITALANNV